MKLLKERLEFEPSSLIEEGTDGKKGYFIEGIFLQADTKNKNGRVYPKKVMANEVARYIREKIETNRAVGELGHPSTPSINYDRVSHKILSLTESGSNYLGKAKVLDTPMGGIVRSLMDEGINFGVSSRGLGSLREQNGANYVGEDFHLVTPADIVSDPSAPDAWVTGLMENKEWAWENGVLVEKEREVKEMINTAARSGLTAEKMVELFEKLTKLV